MSPNEDAIDLFDSDEKPTMITELPEPGDDTRTGYSLGDTYPAVFFPDGSARLWMAVHDNQGELELNWFWGFDVGKRSDCWLLDERWDLEQAVLGEIVSSGEEGPIFLANWLLEHGIAPGQPFLIEIYNPSVSRSYEGDYDVDFKDPTLLEIEPWPVEKVIEEWRRFHLLKGYIFSEERCAVHNRTDDDNDPPQSPFTDKKLCGCFGGENVQCHLSAEEERALIKQLEPVHDPDSNYEYFFEGNRQINCPLCKSENCIAWYKENGWFVIRCETCGEREIANDIIHGGDYPDEQPEDQG